MELYVRTEVPCLAVQPHLAEVELDLGIAGYQRAAWEIFVESFTSIIQTLQSANTEFVTPFADGPQPRLTAPGANMQTVAGVGGDAASWMRASTASIDR